MKEMQFLIKKRRTEVREGKKWSVEFLGHKKVMAGIGRHLATLHQNHTASRFQGQNGTAMNPQTWWRRNRTGALPPNRPRQQTPEPKPSPNEMPHIPTGEIWGAQRSQIIKLTAEYAYPHTSLPCAKCFALDASAQESQHETVVDPDMPTDEGTSTG